MNLKVVETNKENKDFLLLVKLLDNDLIMRYGEMQEKYNVHN